MAPLLGGRPERGARRATNTATAAAAGAVGLAVGLWRRRARAGGICHSGSPRASFAAPSRAAAARSRRRLGERRTRHREAAASRPPCRSVSDSFGLAALRGFALAVLAGTVLKRPLRDFRGRGDGALRRRRPGSGSRRARRRAPRCFSSGWRWRVSAGSWSGVAAEDGARVPRDSAARLGALCALPGITLLARFWPAEALDLGADFTLAGAAGAARLGLAAALFGVLILAAQRSESAATPRPASAGFRPAADLAGRGRSRSWPVGAAAARWRHLARAALAGMGVRTCRLRVDGAPAPGRGDLGDRLGDRLPAALAGARSSGSLAALAPPGPERRAAVAAEVETFFDALDLADVAPEVLPRTEEGDLAYVLWRGSPLARLDAISALVIERPGMPRRASPTACR